MRAKHTAIRLAVEHMMKLERGACIHGATRIWVA